MLLHTLPVGPGLANCYILGKPDSLERVVIDPGGDVEQIREALGEGRVTAILLTHGHFDHMGAVDALADADTQVYAHAKDIPLLTDGEKNASSLMMGAPITVAHAVTPVEDGETIEAAGLIFTALHTPGHTPGGLCWQLGESLFTGDTLFYHSFGRVDLYGGSGIGMRRSLQRLLAMPGELQVYPGHEQATTIGAEQEYFR